MTRRTPLSVEGHVRLFRKTWQDIDTLARVGIRDPEGAGCRRGELQEDTAGTLRLFRVGLGFRCFATGGGELSAGAPHFLIQPPLTGAIEASVLESTCRFSWLACGCVTARPKRKPLSAGFASSVNREWVLSAAAGVGKPQPSLAFRL